MGFRSVGSVVLTAGIFAAAAVVTAPIDANAQLVTCHQGTAIVARAVGPGAMLVPMQVPVNICSQQNGQVVGVVPAFSAVGPATAPMIVPTQLLTRTCAPTVVATTPVIGGGVSSTLAFAQVGVASALVPIAGGGFTALPVIAPTPATLSPAPVVGTAATTTAPAFIAGTFFTVPTTVVTTTPTAFTCF